MPDPAPKREKPPIGDRGPAPDDASADQDGRDRLFRSLARPTRRQLVVAVLLALVGFAGVTQVRATEVTDDYSGEREQDLIDVLDGLAGARQRAEAQRAELEDIREGLLSATNGTQAAIEQATARAETLSILAGLVPVTGSGVRITITEVTGQILLSHMLDVIQELRTVGAEAIQINGEVRVVAQTSFEDVPGGFLVDDQLISPPYVIDVIGDPGVLEGAMVFIEGPASAIRDRGGELEVEKVQSLDIEAMRRPVQPEYAQPDRGQ